MWVDNHFIGYTMRYYIFSMSVCPYIMVRPLTKSQILYQYIFIYIFIYILEMWTWNVGWYHFIEYTLRYQVFWMFVYPCLIVRPFLTKSQISESIYQNINIIKSDLKQNWIEKNRKQIYKTKYQIWTNGVKNNADHLRIIIISWGVIF